MMALLGPWWRDRSRREQALLTGLAAVLALLMAWAAVLRPLTQARAAAEARLAAAVTELGTAQGLAADIRAAEARVRDTTQPLALLIDARLRAAGITAPPVAAEGDGRVRLTIAAVRAPALIGWLTALEQRDGVIVERASIAGNDDFSVSALLVLRTAG